MAAVISKFTSALHRSALVQLIIPFGGFLNFFGHGS